jgi:hypothetical protein
MEMIADKWVVEQNPCSLKATLAVTSVAFVMIAAITLAVCVYWRDEVGRKISSILRDT